MVISSRGEDRAELTLFTAQAHEARIRSIVSLEACKEKQLEFLEKVAASEGDVVKRTVYVDNVHNIRLEKNRKKLGKFFERYGAVEDCIVARYVGKDVNRVLEPAARVLFYHETSAQEALKKKKKDYPQEDCANGSGTILVSKSHHYNIKKNEREASSIELKADRLCFGHYMPNEKHQPNLPWRMNRDNCALEEWLEEYAMNAEIVVRIDMVQKCVELKAPRLFGSNDKFDFSSASDYATICFKSLWGPIDICRCDGSDRFSLVFALKYPPKFESDTTVVGLGYSVDEQGSDRTRGLSFNRLQSVSTAFGECLGLKLDLVDSTSFRRLLHSEVFATLKDFGIVDGDFQREDDARTIASKQIRLDNGKGHAFVLEEISELHDWNATIGKVLRYCFVSSRGSCHLTDSQPSYCDPC